MLSTGYTSFSFFVKLYWVYMKNQIIYKGLQYLLHFDSLIDFQQKTAQFNELVEKYSIESDAEYIELVYDIQAIFCLLNFTGQSEKLDELLDIMEDHGVFTSNKERDIFRAKAIDCMPWLLK